MKRPQPIKKQTFLVLLLGTFFISFSLLTRHFFKTPIDVQDFLIGFGAALIIMSLFVQKKLERESLNS
jgi:hypothetical protein